MDIKKLKESLICNKPDQIIELLSFKQFEEFLYIKDIYNKTFDSSIFFDIKKYIKKDLKLFLIGIFHDSLDFKCYIIHKNNKNKIENLFEYDHLNALEIKKRYFLIFKKNLLEEFNDKNLTNYMSYLLSDYFFPIPDEKDFEKLAEQLIKMYNDNNIDVNLVFYIFQLPNDILFKIIQLYESKSQSKLTSFIQKFFRGDIQIFLERRFFYIFKNSEFLSAQIENTIKSNKSWDVTKILIDYKEDALKIENKLNLNILDENIKKLYENIILFNSHKILIDHIINNIKIIYSIPFIYIFNVDKISLQKYIQSYYEKDSMSYSKWADYIETDLKVLDEFIYDLLYKKNNTFDFKFELTHALAFFIKFIFNYFIIMKNYANILNENIKDAMNDHNSIIKKLSENWKICELYYFHCFLPFDTERQIYTIRYYINELALPFIEKNNLSFFGDNLYYSISNNKIGDEIRKSLYILGDIFFPFKEYDLKILKKFHTSLKNYQHYETMLFIKEEHISKILNPNWKIAKENNTFNISYKNNLINYTNKF